MKKILCILAFVIIIQFTFNIDNCKAQWVQCSGINGLSVNSFATLGNKLFAGTSGGIYYSTDNGTNWTLSLMSPFTITSLAVSGNNIFAGMYYNSTPPVGGIYLSIDTGTSWISISQYVLYYPVYSLTVQGNTVFAGTESGVFISTNNGGSWNSGNLYNLRILSLAISGNNILAGVNNYPMGSGGVWLSNNYGNNWILTSLFNKSVYALAINGNTIYAGTNCDSYTGIGGVYRSNNGSNWVLTSLNDKIVFALAAEGNNVFAGTINVPSNYGGVWLSLDIGTNWVQKNQGFSDYPWVKSLFIKDNYIFAGTDNKIYRRTLSEIIGIQNISTETPSGFSLRQNYPNPFNPSTKIKFDIPVSARHALHLQIFDMLGKEVATLVNEKLSPGTYEVDWNASEFPSGVYFYRLTTDGFSDTKRMLLVK
jgi:hypothetical protein